MAQTNRGNTVTRVQD